MPVGGDDDDGQNEQDLEDLLAVEAAANIGKCPVPGCPWHKKEGTESMRANAATSHVTSTQDYIHEDFREYGAAPAAVATDNRWDGWLKDQPPVVQQAAIKFRADCERARSDDREILNLQVEWFRLNKNQALGAPTQEIKHKRLKNVELIKALRARQKGEAVPEHTTPATALSAPKRKRDSGAADVAAMRIRKRAFLFASGTGTTVQVNPKKGDKYDAELFKQPGSGLHRDRGAHASERAAHSVEDMTHVTVRRLGGAFSRAIGALGSLAGVATAETEAVALTYVVRQGGWGWVVSRGSCIDA